MEGSRFEVFWLVKLIMCVVSRFSSLTMSTAHIHREVQSGDFISRINSRGEAVEDHKEDEERGV